MTQPYIGAPMIRKEDVRFLTGQGNYLDDITRPGMLHAALLRSPHAHARIARTDTTEAAAMPGVSVVFTYDDIASLAKAIPIRVFELPGLDRFLQVPLARDKVRHVGEPVAMVVAESRYLAEDALEAIYVEYEPLPAVTGVRDALKDEVVLHEDSGTNLAGHTSIATGDVDEAFRTADYTRREEFTTNRHTGNPMETRGLLADYDADSEELTVWGPTKGPLFQPGHPRPAIGTVRGENTFHRAGRWRRIRDPRGVLPRRLSGALRLDEAGPAREIGRGPGRAPDVGQSLPGGGLRGGNSGPHRRDALSMRATVFGDMGAYIRTHGSVVPALTASTLTGPYRVPAFQADVNCVMTNKMGAGTYRAPGFFEAAFIRERMLDLAAADLSLDPAEIRRKNLIKASEMPYTVGPTRIDGRLTVYDSGDYHSAFDRVLREIGYESLKDQGRDSQGRYHGVGLASYVEPTGFGPYEGARVALNDAGEVEVYLGITTMGQGHETVMAQICADSLGVPIEEVRVYHGSTDYLPASVGTFGSRASVMAGSAIHLTCQTLKAKILAVAAGYLDTEPSALDLRQGRVFRVDGPPGGETLTLRRVVQLAEAGRQFDSPEPPLEATEYFRVEEWTYAYGSHAAHVAVDPETGKIEVVRYLVVEDVGRCINPLTMHGQSVGGAAQGIGGSILEELVYDGSGQLLSGSFMDYLLPTSNDVPNIECIILEEAPSPLNPLGVKGAGEGAILATGAALANAVADALSPLGVPVNRLPLSPDNILSWIRSAGG